ncbi:MAG: hypothetical protein ACLUAO_04255 [Streptococcus sp.]
MAGTWKNGKGYDTDF